VLPAPSSIAASVALPRRRFRDFLDGHVVEQRPRTASCASCSLPRTANWKFRSYVPPGAAVQVAIRAGDILLATKRPVPSAPATFAGHARCAGAARVTRRRAGDRRARFIVHIRPARFVRCTRPRSARVARAEDAFLPRRPTVKIKWRPNHKAHRPSPVLRRSLCSPLPSAPLCYIFLDSARTPVPQNLQE